MFLSRGLVSIYAQRLPCLKYDWLGVTNNWYTVLYISARRYTADGYVCGYVLKSKDIEPLLLKFRWKMAETNAMHTGRRRTCDSWCRCLVFLAVNLFRTDSHSWSTFTCIIVARVQRVELRQPRATAPWTLTRPGYVVRFSAGRSRVPL